MPKTKILVVDDEEDILELVRYNLAKEGFDVAWLTSGEAALKYAKERHPDLIVLDLMLPGVDGFDVCRKLKRDDDTASIPIIMLTAKGEDADIVAGLELGADDYVVKPFSPRVLTARVRAALRRKGRDENDPTIVDIEGIVVDPARHVATVGGERLDLTATEFGILYFLGRRPGWVFTRSQIIAGVKGADYSVTERSVDVQITALRKKLGDAGKMVETVRGVGYRFKD